MAAVTQVQVLVTARDEATKVINGVGKSFQDMGGMSAEAKRGADVVAGAFTAVAVTAIGVSAASVKMASDFQSSMTLVQTQAGASAQEVKNMTAAILQLAPAVGQTPEKLAKGLFYIESAGFQGAKALDILKLSAEGAAVGHANLTEVAKSLTSVMNSGIKGFKDATGAMGVLNAIVGNGKMTMDDLTGALATGILPAAKQVGLSIQDVGAALDVMTNNGIPAQEAATRLRMTLSLMEAPTAQAAKKLAEVGLSSRQLADDMQKGGIIAAITDLNNHMNATTPASTAIVKGTKMTATQLTDLGDKILTTNDRLQKLQSETGKTTLAKKTLADQIKTTQDKLAEYSGKMSGANSVIQTLGGSTLDVVGKAQLLTKAFGGARSGSTIELLTQQADMLKGRLEGVNATSKNFANSWQKTQEDNAFAMQKLGAKVNTLMVQYGTLLLPVVTQVANFFSKNLGPALSSAATFFEHNKLALTGLAVVLGGLFLFGLLAVGVAIWTALIAPTIAFIGVIAAATVAVFLFLVPFLPIIAIGIAVAAVIFLIMTHLKEIGAFFGTLGHIFNDFFSGADITLNSHEAGWAGFVKMLLGFRDTVIGVFNNVKNFFTGLWTAASETFTKINNASHGLVAVLLIVFLPFIAIPILIITHFGQIVTFFRTLPATFQTIWASITKVFDNFIKWVKTTFGPAFKVAMDVINFVMIVVHDLFVLAWAGIQFVLTAFGNWLKTTFGPVVDGVFKFIDGLLQREENGWKNIWHFITNLLKEFGNWLKATFSPMINAAFLFIQGILTDLSNFFTTIWNAITSTLNSFGEWLGKTFNPVIDGAFKWIEGALNTLASAWSRIWNGIKSFVSGIANDIMGIVKSMLNAIIGFFNGIIHGANAVGGKIPGFIHIPSLPTLQTGGIVPGAVGSPVLIMAHGGETVVPVGTTRGAEGGSSESNVTINVNVGLYAGSETDKRNIAKQLYAALQQLAQSQHKTVAAYMGG